MSKRRLFIIMAQLLFLFACTPATPPLEETPPKITTLPPLENVPTMPGYENGAKPGISDVLPSVEFDEDFTALAKSYFEMMNANEVVIRLYNISRNNVRVELGDNPQITINLYNQNVFSVNGRYEFEKQVIYHFSNSLQQAKVEFVETPLLNFQYDFTTAQMQFENEQSAQLYENSKDVQDLFANSLLDLNKQKEQHILFQASTLKIMKEMMLSSYHKQAILFDKEIIQKLQPLLIESQIYTLPLSYIYNVSTLWIMGEVQLRLTRLENRKVLSSYYAEEAVTISYTLNALNVEQAVLLAYENGQFTLSLEGNEDFYYTYEPTKNLLLLNGKEYFEKEEEFLFLEQASMLMGEFYNKYNGYTDKMESLISEIESAL